MSVHKDTAKFGVIMKLCTYWYTMWTSQDGDDGVQSTDTIPATSSSAYVVTTTYK